MLYLGPRQVRSVLSTAELRNGLAAGYRALTAGTAHAPTRVMVRTDTGLLGSMPASVPGFGLGAKLVTVNPSNTDRPTHHALVMLFDEVHGAPLALLDGEVITEMRTAASSALACDLLAAPDASVLTIIGAGVQGTGHLHAFAALRNWREIRLVNRTADRARVLAGQDPRAMIFADVEDAVRGADVVACTTDAPAPLFTAESFTGSFLSTVGLHLEVPPGILDGADVVVQTRTAVTTPPPNGPALVHGLDPEAVVELGELLAGNVAAGRGRAVWASVGNGMEDVVAARLAYDRARTLGIGTEI